MYAEDPRKDYQPSAGLLTEVVYPEDPRVRVDAWAETGQQVTSHYDPMLAKVIVHAPGRTEAFAASRRALAATRFTGVQTNLPLLREAVGLPDVLAATHTTGTLAGVTDDEPYIDVVRPGVMTTVQDWPGRLGFWDVGISPSGPMDDLSFRLGNRALGNAEGAPGLECTLTGPRLRFSHETVVCVTGAPAPVTVDGSPVPQWEPVTVPAGGVLDVGAPHDAGLRTYVLLRGGLDVPLYLGSASTFSMGGFGGYTGRALVVGDTLVPGVPLGPPPVAVPEDVRPQLVHEWEVAVQEGPQPAPSYFTPADMEMFYASTWQVQTHANRTGIRLTGPKPQWARPDGGEAGPAPVEPARQPVLGRRAERLRRHPDPAGPRRSEPRRVRLPADGRRRPPLEDGPDPPRRHGPAGAGARRDRGRPAHRRRPARVRAPRPGRRSPAPTVTTACSPGSPARPTSSTCAAATTTCSSSTARWCWTSACACACTPWARR